MAYKLNLGVAQGVITPKVGCCLYGYAPDVISEKVNDDLTATAYYFSDGSTKAMMINVTVCAMAAWLCDELAEKIGKNTGIPKENIVFSATHTHSGPTLSGTAGWGDFNKEYADEIFIPTVLKLASKAVANAEPVRMGIAVGESLVGINRRELLEDNTVKLGQNPWGPFNKKMTVVSFKTESGDIKASMVHYGCHGTAAGRNHEISRDWPGVMVDAVTEYGGGVCAFFNGPEGDTGPRLMNGRTIGFDEKNGKSGNIVCAMELGAYAAHDAVRIFKDTRGYHDATLEVIPATLKIPLKARPSLEVAKEEYEKYKEYTVNILAKKAAHFKMVIESYENGYKEEKYKEIKYTVIRIGDVAFVGYPLELFSEIGMRVQSHSPIPHTLPLSLTGGSLGYFPTESELCRGGYEIEAFKHAAVQPCVDNGDFHIVTQTLEQLRLLKGE